MAMAYTIVVWFLYCLGVLFLGSLGLFLAFCSYLYHIHKINEHLPGPPRQNFILGHLQKLWEYRKGGRAFVNYILDTRLEYGPIFVLFFLHRAVVFLGDPKYVRQVFIDSHVHLYKSKYAYHKIGFVFGERGGGYGLVSNTDKKVWRKRRQLMNPAFHRKCLKNFMTDFNQVCDRLLDRLDKVAETGKETSMLREFANATLDVISQVSFNVNIGAIENTNSRFSSAIVTYMRGVQANMNISLSPDLLAIFQFRLFQSATQREQIEATKFLRRFAFQCISDRISDIKAGKEVPHDLLSVLVSDNTLSKDDIMDEFLTIFIAGQETTANSLAFALYEVIKNPDIEAKIRKEVRDVLGGKKSIDFEDLPRLKYLGQTLQEGLRKHPVVGGPSRLSDKDLDIGGYIIPKGNIISTDKYIFSHNPEIWENPDVFDPRRFDEPEKIPNFSSVYFPFSIGPQSCIGQTFAKFESKVFLARVLQRFHFKLVPGQTDQMEERLTIAPRDGVMCNIVKRV